MLKVQRDPHRVTETDERDREVLPNNDAQKRMKDLHTTNKTEGSINLSKSPVWKIQSFFCILFSLVRCLCVFIFNPSLRSRWAAGVQASGDQPQLQASSSAKVADLNVSDVFLMPGETEYAEKTHSDTILPTT